MKKDFEENENINGLQIFGMVVPLLPKLVLNLSMVFLRFKRKAKKGGQIFKEALINQGLEEDLAEELTNIYLESSNIANYIHLFR